MIAKVINFFTSIGLESIDQIADRIGLSSIAASLGITANEALGSTWHLADYALLISALGGILFIIEKIFVIYLRYKESKKVSHEDDKPPS